MKYLNKKALMKVMISSIMIFVLSPVFSLDTKTFDIKIKNHCLISGGRSITVRIYDKSADKETKPYGKETDYVGGRAWTFRTVLGAENTVFKDMAYNDYSVFKFDVEGGDNFRNNSIEFLPNVKGGNSVEILLEKEIVESYGLETCVIKRIS